MEIHLTKSLSKIPNWRIWLGFIFAMALVIFLLQKSSLNSQFLSDDYDWVRNARIAVEDRQWLKAFQEPNGGNFYRPLIAFSFQIDYLFNKYSPPGYYLHQIIINLILVVSVAWLVFEIFKKKSIAFLSATLFAVYPSHHEVITWLAGRPDLYATFFIVLSLALFAKFFNSKKISWYILSFVVSILAFLSKETAFVLPAFLALIVLIKETNFTFKNIIKKFLWLLPWIVLVIIFLIIRQNVLTDAIGGYQVGGENQSANFSIANLAKPFNSPLYLVNWRYALNKYGDQGTVNQLFQIFKFLIQYWWAIPALLLGYLVYLWKRKKIRNFKLLLFGILWSIIGFIPVYGLSSAINYSLNASRLFYLSSIGYCLIIVAVLAGNYQRKFIKVIQILIIISLIFSFLTLWKFNQKPWLTASDVVGQVKTKFSEQQAELIKPEAKYVFFEDLPIMNFGAYMFFSRLTALEFTRSIILKDIPKAFQLTEFPINDSPFCNKVSKEEILLLDWNAKNKKFEIIDRNIFSENKNEELIFDFTKPEQISKWNFNNLTYSQTTGGLLINFDPRSELFIESPKFNQLKNTSYKSLVIDFQITKDDPMFGNHQIKLNWETNNEYLSRNIISYAFAKNSQYLTSIPLCKYINWNLSENFSRLKIKPIQSGQILLKSIKLMP
ncbi:MAG: glycosyltransferase family 39 protein [Patescibacteria group bacterium]|jgi:hypothetical protein